VNCDSLGDGQQGQSLFGSEGAIARAEGGTLFLNDLFSLPKGQQSQLSALLSARGDDKKPPRILSACADATRKAIESGAFRADLYFRLSLLPILIPPLRERRDDLPMLIEHFLQSHSRNHRKPLRQISPAARDLLLRYDFPGNVRELSNMIERGVIYAEPGGDLEISHLFTGIEQRPEFVDGLHRSGRIVRRRSTAAAVDGGEGRSFVEMEEEAYRAALDAAKGNVAAAARALGLSRAKLDYRLSKLCLRNPGENLGKATGRSGTAS
jgi:two-component system, NtrC family, response regulator HydG